MGLKNNNNKKKKKQDFEPECEIMFYLFRLTDFLKFLFILQSGVCVSEIHGR